jgi:hypothetical protein
MMSRGRRYGLLFICTVALLATGTSIAAADPTFGVMNAAGGIYWRSAPDWNTPVAIAGNGFYPNSIIAVHCYQAGAGNVPGSTDYMWEQATVVGGSGSGSGWVNEHFINDGAPINQPSPGVPPCGASTPPPAPTPAPTPTPAPPSATPLASGQFRVMNADGGIYWRSSPEWNTAVAVSGNGVYPGTVIAVSCFQRGAANVPGTTDSMWELASVAGGPGSGSGWINEHFINDGAAINQPSPGVPPCSGSTGGGAPPSGGGHCTDQGCRDSSPASCQGDATTLDTASGSGFSIELRYSPSCRAAWARVSGTTTVGGPCDGGAPYRATAFARVEEATSADSGHLAHDATECADSGNFYTPMVGAGRWTRACISTRGDDWYAPNGPTMTDTACTRWHLSGSPSGAQLSAALTPAKPTVSSAGLLRSNGYTVSFSAPSAGRLDVALFRSASASTARISRRNRLGEASRSFATAGRSRLKVKLTSTGRRLLRRGGRLRLNVEGTFSPAAGGPAVSQSATFVVRR